VRDEDRNLLCGIALVWLYLIAGSVDLFDVLGTLIGGMGGNVKEYANGVLVMATIPAVVIVTCLLVVVQSTRTWMKWGVIPLLGLNLLLVFWHLVLLNSVSSR